MAINSEGVRDILLRGSSIVNSEGIATIPVSTGVSSFGVVSIANNSGIGDYNDLGYLYINNTADSSIASRSAQMSSGYGAITTANFDYAVKAALTDGTGDFATITANDNPVLDVIITSSSSIDSENEAWSKVWKCETIDGGITLYASETPAVAINVAVKW